MKLHQVLAVEKGQKKTTTVRLTEIYHSLQKTALLEGRSRNYHPKNEDGDQLPAQNQEVQVRVPRLLADARQVVERLWDIAFTKEAGNAIAMANVVVNGQVILNNAPATYLLWLDKHELPDLLTLISKLPTLDPGEVWSWSDGQDCYASEPQETTRTKKVPRVLVKAPATEKHQADTEVWYEDAIEGSWVTILFSGALPATTVREMTERVQAVQEAVRIALSEANSTEVPSLKVNGPLLDYVFGSNNNARGSKPV